LLLLLLFIRLVVLKTLYLFFVLDFVAHVFFSLPVSHSAAITLEILVIFFSLLLVFLLVVLPAEALVDQVEEDPLRKVAEL